MEKLPKLTPSKALLPARMSLNLDALGEVRFATLDFPFAKALHTFEVELTTAYNNKHRRDQKEKLAYEDRPPFRQLNTALMACCPVLVHAFEKYGDVRRMVAIDRLERDPQTGAIHSIGSQFPAADAFRELIEEWIDQWMINTELIELVNSDPALKSAMKALKKALAQPETAWQEDVTLRDLVNGLSHHDAMGYDIIPAAIIALLHGQTMYLHTRRDDRLPIMWRKAHDGGARGLHLVSQPFQKFSSKSNRHNKKALDNDEPEETKDGFYVYRLDVRVQTQVGHQDAAGHLKPWIFLDVGMRRYPHEAFKKDQVFGRNLSVLFGFNREQLSPAEQAKLARYPHDSTLVKLRVRVKDSPTWDDNLSQLLSAYGLSPLDDAKEVLAAPARYGNLGSGEEFKGNEYYLIHAEGRKYGDEETKRGHGHAVQVGFTLKERTEIVQRVLELLPDVLTPDAPFEQDLAAPKGRNVPEALRSYDFFEPTKQDSEKREAEKLESTLEAIRFALQAGGHDLLDIAIIHSSADFLQAASEKLRAILPGGEAGNPPFVCIHTVNLSPMYFMSLDGGGLDPYSRSPEHRKQWTEQMKRSRQQKVEEWHKGLNTKIGWRPGARRLALIESFYETKDFKADHESQQIKGAVRQACSRQGIASQFLGTFAFSESTTLKAGDEGRLESAVLDLLLRQTGARYGTPADLYARAAMLPPEYASTLDVVAFWHEDKFLPLHPNGKHLVTVMAVRLRADGRVEVITPQTLDRGWLSYVEAGPLLGKLVAEQRSAIRSKQPNPLQLRNDAVMGFVQAVLTKHLDAPTVAVVPAAWWRNASDGYQGARWPQLGNKRLFANRNVLDFKHIPGCETFTRDDARFANLVGVVRLRMDDETPQYTAGTPIWDAAQQTGDVDVLSGYVDCTVRDPLHYFSLAGESGLQKEQSANYSGLKNAYKMDLNVDYSYRHAHLLELVPFFLREDFQHEDAQKTLCRCVHLLRVSPAFSKANILLPYPMHLAKVMIDDLLCIVDIYT